jgi:thioesterase domain-containing protein/acyl carrier protein
VPPNNITEIALTQIWQDILGINNIGILDVFEDLGGHSLNALHLLTKVEDKFRVKISLQSFTESNTIQKMAAKIDGGGSSMHPSSAAVVTIRSMGKEQPLFCLHPVGGNTFCYLPLAKYLKYDCPIYGLQDPSLQAGKIMFASLEEMATYYVAAIRQIQAHGPYMLCGLSFGATLSIEVARQLRQEGAQVKPLVLFDGWAQFSDMQSQEMLFKEVAMQRANKNIQASFADMSWERMKLLLKYEVPIILDKLILFKAKTLLPEYKYINHPNNYWEKYTSNPIAVHIISGDHETILEEPNIVYLAKKMDEILCELSIENCLT